MEKSNELNESLKRYRELLGYNTKTGGRSLTERNHAPYLDGITDYADDETETEEEALEIFRRESLKVDYSKSKIDHLTSGWNPKVKKIKEKVNG